MTKIDTIPDSKGIYARIQLRIERCLKAVKQRALSDLFNRPRSYGPPNRRLARDAGISDQDYERMRPKRLPSEQWHHLRF